MATGCNCVLFSENAIPNVSVSPCHRLYFAAVWSKYKRAHAQDRWHFKQEIDVREEIAFCVSRAHNTSYNPRTSRPRCSSLSSRRSTKSSSFKSVLYYQELNSWTNLRVPHLAKDFLWMLNVDPKCLGRPCHEAMELSRGNVVTEQLSVAPPEHLDTDRVSWLYQTMHDLYQE